MHIKLHCWSCKTWKTKRNSILFLDRSLKKVEDAPSRVERQIYDSGAQMKAGSVAEMEKADEFKTDEFVINDYKNLTVKCAQDKLSKKMKIQKSRILNCRIWKTLD